MTPDSYGSEPTDQSEQLKAQKIEVYLKEGLNYIKQYQPNEAIRHFIQTDVLKKVGVDCRLDEIRGFNDNLQKKTKVPFDIYNSGFAFAVKDGMPEITRSELPFLLENFNPSDPSPLQLDCIALNFAMSYLDVLRYFKKTDSLTGNVSSKKDSLGYFMFFGLNLPDTFTTYLLT